MVVSLPEPYDTKCDNYTQYLHLPDYKVQYSKEVRSSLIRFCYINRIFIFDVPVWGLVFTFRSNRMNIFQVVFHPRIVLMSQKFYTK